MEVSKTGVSYSAGTFYEKSMQISVNYDKPFLWVGTENWARGIKIQVDQSSMVTIQAQNLGPWNLIQSIKKNLSSRMLSLGQQGNPSQHLIQLKETKGEQKKIINKNKNKVKFSNYEKLKCEHFIYFALNVCWKTFTMHFIT